MKLDRETPFLLVTGVARSGTTLFAECLDHHPQIFCASDPLNEFFKGFLHFAYYKVHGTVKDPGYPMDHHFFSGSSRVADFIQHTDLTHPIPEHLRLPMLQRIARRGGIYSPAVAHCAQQTTAATFDALFLELMQLLVNASGRDNLRYAGFKDGYLEQMLLPLSRTFPNMKFINVIRDPRAVAGSNWASDSVHPVYFTLRDWRKSIYYSWLYQQPGHPLRDKFIALRYEDLLSAPEQVLSQASQFLGIAYMPQMISAPFKTPNSSYAAAAGGGILPLKDRWREHLPAEIQQQIGIFCGPEMQKSGYAQDSSCGGKPAPCTDAAYDRLGAWCRKLLPPRWIYASLWRWSQWLLESVRCAFIRKAYCPQNFMRQFFQSQDYFRWLCAPGNLTLAGTRAAESLAAR